MKKFVLGLIALCITNSCALAGDYYNSGVNYFDKKDYSSAAKNFESALRQNPKNVNARYYLAQVYLLQNRVDEAKDQYSRIILIAPMSDASRLSEKGLFLIVQAQNGNSGGKNKSSLSQYQDNYLEYVISGSNEAKKWKNFPLRVYIEPQKQSAACKKAFLQWENQTNKLVSFIFVPSEKSAQIVLKFENKLENSSTQEAFVAGTTKPYYQNGYMVKADIKVLSKDPQTKQLIDDDYIYFTTLHEIGHALGMHGHSPDKNDVMYAQSSEAGDKLSQRDINTINMFYKADKKYLASLNKTKGSNSQLTQAINYANSHPDKAIGWLNLADLYKDKGIYQEAIKYYSKAATIEPSRADLQNSLGLAYSLINDDKSALACLKRACDLDKTNSLYLYQFVNQCIKSNKSQLGEIYLTNFIQTNPKNANDPKIVELKKHFGQ